MKKKYLPLLKRWRNEQINVLRQASPLTDSDQERWFRKIQYSIDQVIAAILASDKKNSPNFMGYCGITNINRKRKRGEISFLVDTSRARDRKLYKEDFLSSLYFLCRYGFETLELNYIYTETYVFRRYHIKILEDFGFRRKKILKDRKFINNKHWDSVIHSLSKKEWPKISKDPS
jgi:RimJ/RimL family protein N-acetyltransferase